MNKLKNLMYFRLLILAIQFKKGFALILHSNGTNCFLLINATKIYQFKIKDLVVKPYILCSSNISKNFISDNMKKKQG